MDVLHAASFSSLVCGAEEARDRKEKQTRSLLQCGAPVGFLGIPTSSESCERCVACSFRGGGHHDGAPARPDLLCAAGAHAVREDDRRNIKTVDWHLNSFGLSTVFRSTHILFS